MCSIESMRPSPTSDKLSDRTKRLLPPPSLKMIEKRLFHLRQELRHLTRRELDLTNGTHNVEQQQTTDSDNHHVQYKKRLNQLLRLHDKQVSNLHLWRFYRSHTIEQMYTHELRQSDEAFQMKKSDFKSKLLSSFADKRRHLDFEHQNVSIRRRHDSSEHDQMMLNGAMFSNVHNGIIGDAILFDAHNHHTMEFAQQQQQAQQQHQRPSYYLRRAAAADMVSENASATPASSLTNLSIFSRSNSLLPPFGGIELQRCLATADIEQDVKDVHDGLTKSEPINRTDSSRDNEDASIKYIDVRIEEGRLWYQRAWFSRNSPILLVFDDLEIVPALVLTIGRNDLLIRRSGTNIKHRVSLALLHDGHLAIRKRGVVF